MVTMTIDGRQVLVEDHESLVAAAEKAGIKIPTLCAMRGINDIGACRVCVVEVEGRERLVSACNSEVEEGMVVLTNSPKARRARKTNVELILSRHDARCALCTRSGNCELQTLANDLGVMSLPYEERFTVEPWSKSFPLIRDSSKCILCMRCVQVCEKMQGLSIWDIKNDGVRMGIGVSCDTPIEESKCSLCGQCITHCPVEALRERDDTDAVFAALADPDIVTVVQIAPAVRTAWGESLAIPREQATAGRLVAALRRMGFDYVFDTSFAADLTIMEEASEFVERLSRQNQEKSPMFTSCCPGWVRYLKARHPERLDDLSSAKSPQQMFGAVMKTYFKGKPDLNPEKLFCVSIMPCIAKKYERSLGNMQDAGFGHDVDVAITTREMDRMIKAEHIEVSSLPEEPFDVPLGTGTGAAVIFGATGGVMEAALRSAYHLVNGSNPDPEAFKDVRGVNGWREKTFDMGGVSLKIAVVSGLGNAGALLDALDAGEVDYDFIEVMACPGGCSGGGGQPITNQCEPAMERGDALYRIDKASTLRFSHDNPAIQKCYASFLEAPLSEKAKALLHTDQAAWSMLPSECQPQR